MCRVTGMMNRKCTWTTSRVHSVRGVTDRPEKPFLKADWGCSLVRVQLQGRDNWWITSSFFLLWYDVWYQLQLFWMHLKIAASSDSHLNQHIVGVVMGFVWIDSNFHAPPNESWFRWIVISMQCTHRCLRIFIFFLDTRIVGNHQICSWVRLLHWELRESLRECSKQHDGRGNISSHTHHGFTCLISACLYRCAENPAEEIR